MPAVLDFASRGARQVLWLFVLVIPSNTVLAAKTPTVLVETARESKIVRQIPLTGTITSAKAARLSPEVSGQVKTINVDFGDHVVAGDELLLLDREISELEYQSSQAMTEQAKAELEDAQRRYTDAKRLRKQRNISENEFQLREAEVRIRAAALKRQEAEELKQKARYERHVVRAPFDGVISQKLTEEGEWVEPGNPVFELVALDSLHADFSVPQTFYPQIDDNSRITLTIEALSRKQFDGVIDAVVPVNDPSARTFMMRVLFKNEHPKIIPGMSVHGLLQVSSGLQGIAISRDAVLRYPDGRVTVWVAGQENGKTIVHERRVDTGYGFDGNLEIRSGLQVGDVVVVEGNEALQDGQEVSIKQRGSAGES
ncbi:MAG: efflux RND transporter periplasmic adaptor subunit [Thiohalophilus sp.]|jgi:RND family efflux transporter MFP subunit